MFNDLRANPDVRQNYQFWFYLYPTGQPFWTSAAQMREDLARMRQELDPQRREPALDQMVLVGHSMGGLVSKLQTVDSGDDFWSTVSNTPFQLVKASPQTRRDAGADVLLRSQSFDPPRGDDRHAAPRQRLRQQLHAVRGPLADLPAADARQRHDMSCIETIPDLFRDKSFTRSKTSIDSLAPDSPLLPVLLTGRRPPWVKYHNIVGVEGYNEEPASAARGSDGIVSFAERTSGRRGVRADRRRRPHQRPSPPAGRARSPPHSAGAPRLPAPLARPADAALPHDGT